MAYQIRVQFFGDLTEKIELSWQDILYALENDKMANDFVIEYAVYKAKKVQGEYPDYLLKMLLLEISCSKQDIMELVSIASSAEAKIEESTLKDRCLYLIMLNLSLENLPHTDLQAILAEEFDDFSFPEKMRPLIHYLPNDENDEIQCSSWSETLRLRLNRYLIEENPFV